MTKVYIITSGEYSDYSINSVFLDKEQAERYVRESNEGEESRWYGDPEIEEWDTNDDFIGFGGLYHKQGFVNQSGVSNSHSYTLRSELPVGGIKVDLNFGRDFVNLIVSGVDVARVEKVFGERAAHIIAEWDILWAQYKSEE